MLRLFVCIAAVSVVSLVPARSMADESAEELKAKIGPQLQSQDFKEAAKSLRKLVELEKENSRAWQLLGYSLHMSGDLDAAITAHKKAATFEATKGIALYNLGCAYTIKDDKDKAFGFLNKAVKAGFKQVSQYTDDTDLDNLRKDVRFKRLMKRVRDESVSDDFSAKQLVGTWTVVSETEAGTKAEDPAETIKVEADKFTRSGSNQAVPYSVDTSTVTPTLKFADVVGIIKLNGKSLTICVTDDASKTPDKFESTADNGYTLLVLRREMDDSQLVGTWNYVSGERAGKAVAKERLAGQVAVTKDRFTIPASPTENFVMKYSLDSSDGKTSIDLTIESGPVPEGKAVGIIKVEGDRMTLCYNPMGEQRPKDFSSTEDNGYFLFTLERAKK